MSVVASYSDTLWLEYTIIEGWGKMGYGGKWDAFIYFLLNGLPETNYFMKLLV